MQANFFLTGGSGFLASRLYAFLSRESRVYSFTRAASSLISSHHKSYECFDTYLNTTQGSNVVIHCAGLAHLSGRQSSKHSSSYFTANVDFALEIASRAIAAKASHFIFISTIGVHGSGSFSDPTFTVDESSPLSPDCLYSYSKLLAEYFLLDLFSSSHTQLFILRPPLIYGPNPPGNLLKLQRYLSLGLPVPVSSIPPMRSLLYVGNLASLIQRIPISKASSSCAYVISDLAPVTLPDIITSLRNNSSYNIFPPYFLAPPVIESCFRTLPFLRSSFAKLNSSLIVNSERLYADFDWIPPFSINDFSFCSSHH